VAPAGARRSPQPRDERPSCRVPNPDAAHTLHPPSGYSLTRPPNSEPGASFVGTAEPPDAQPRPPIIAPDGGLLFHHAMLRPVTDRERPPPERSSEHPRCIPGCSHTPLHPPTHENVQSPLGPRSQHGGLFLPHTPGTDTATTAFSTRMQHLNSALHPLRYSASVVRTTGAFFLSAATPTEANLVADETSSRWRGLS
jgi:hypothetical protein